MAANVMVRTFLVVVFLASPFMELEQLFYFTQLQAKYFLQIIQPGFISQFEAAKTNII